MMFAQMQNSLSFSSRSVFQHRQRFSLCRETSRSQHRMRAHSKETYSNTKKKSEVLAALSTIIDPDLEEDIVKAGFIKELSISGTDVSFTVELTTPACPIKAEFERQCQEKVSLLGWVDSVSVKMTAAEKTDFASNTRTGGLKDVAHVVGVYSCKGGWLYPFLSV